MAAKVTISEASAYQNRQVGSLKKGTLVQVATPSNENPICVANLTGLVSLNGLHTWDSSTYLDMRVLLPGTFITVMVRSC